MICKDCANRDHNACTYRNHLKDYSDCDCQHRVSEKTTEDINGDGKES